MKMSPKQKKIAKTAMPTNKITGADFKALKKKPKESKGKLLAGEKFYGQYEKKKPKKK